MKNLIWIVIICGLLIYCFPIIILAVLFIAAMFTPTLSIGLAILIALILLFFIFRKTSK